MAVLETLEGDNMEPEILNAGTFGVNMARASLKALEPDMADVLNRKPRRPVRRLPARGAVGARPLGSSSGRFVMVGEDFDPESLEGWLTDIKKGSRKAVRAVGNVGSAIVRPVASVGLNVLRSTAPIAGSFIGSAAQSSGMGGGSTAAAPDGTPAAMPATSGGIPPIYLIGGGTLLLVLLLRK